MPTEIEAARQQAQLRTLMRLLSIVDAAGQGVLGKGAPAMMYQAGRDEGLAAEPSMRTDDFEEALKVVLAEGDEVWHVEKWCDPGQEGEWIEEGDRRARWLLFRRCPLLELAQRVGAKPGGLLCQALHGQMAGSLEGIIGRRVDLRVAHCGPGACKLRVEMRD
jgi:predicted hydrocarbon binding protein